MRQRIEQCARTFSRRAFGSSNIPPEPEESKQSDKMKIERQGSTISPVFLSHFPSFRKLQIGRAHV